MQTIQGMIEQKRVEVSKLQEEIKTLERAQALLNGSEPAKRRGRPKGSKNKVASVKTKLRKISKKTDTKGTRKRAKRHPAATGESATE